MTPELYQACRRAIHVVCADGTLLRAGRASMFMLERLGWGWVARLLSRRPLIWGVELGYWLVANHRIFFSRLLFRSESLIADASADAEQSRQHNSPSSLEPMPAPTHVASTPAPSLTSAIESSATEMPAQLEGSADGSEETGRTPPSPPRASS